MSKKIKCPKCEGYSCRLVRYGDSEPWMCPDCYLGLYLDHTPQTKWAEEESTVVQRAEAFPNLLPTVLDYKEFLDEICKRDDLDRDEARNRYGKFTYKEWAKLLKISENE